MPESVRGRDSTERSWGRNPFEVFVYLATVPLLRALARLPLSVLYRVSDVAFWLVYRICGCGARWRATICAVRSRKPPLPSGVASRSAATAITATSRSSGSSS